MTSEVTSDLGIELSDLDYLCTHGFVASISSNSIKFTEKKKEAKHDPLTCVASPQVKMLGYTKVSLLIRSVFFGQKCRPYIWDAYPSFVRSFFRSLWSLAQEHVFVPGKQLTQGRRKAKMERGNPQKYKAGRKRGHGAKRQN